MKIIGFINQKGGVGKTTFLLNTAFFLAKAKNKIFILDTDPQSSVCNFMEHRESLGIESVIDYTSGQISALKTILKSIEQKKYDYFLIDTAGSASNDVLQATKLMNYIIIPMQSSWLDINSGASFIEAISNYNIATPYKIIINGVNANSTNIAVELQEYFIKQKIDVFKSYLCYRKPYKDSIYEGKTIIETIDEKNNCIIEFNSYIKELLVWIQ